MALTEIHRGNGVDIPTTPTSSVGEVVYPPVLASEGRKKGIFPRVIVTGEDMTRRAEELRNIPLGGTTSRISVRYFVENEVLRNLTRKQKEELSPLLEGIVELAGDGDAFSDCSIVYLGNNSPERHTDPAVFAAEIQMAQNIFKSPPSSKEYDYSQFTFREITPEDRVDNRIIDQYAQLYSAFGWNREQVVTILQNPASILLGTFVNDQLVSAGMAERAEFSIERNGVLHPFVMYEITEAATQVEYRGMGLYTKVARELMKLLALTDIDLLYGESNLLSEAVLRAAHALERTSSIETLEKYGFYPRALEQHVRISGGPHDMRPETEKNDLLPTSMTRDKLLQYAYAL